MPVLSLKDRFNLHFQRLVDRLFFVITGYLITFVVMFVGGIKFRDLKRHRREFRELFRDPRPLVICGNHLTMIDSVLIHIGMSSMIDYLLHWRRFSWNIPAIENFRDSMLMRVITYMGKCIPIDRQGTPEHLQNVLDKLRHLLRTGDIFTIFPEGTRSRSGRIEMESVTYGVGNIIKDIPGCRVLCVYIRGDRQDTYSNFPHKGDTLYIKTEVIVPQSDKKGMRAARELSVQVLEKLKSMEDEYFAMRGGAV